VTTAAECQNCGAALAGAYCSACGQKADVRIVSLPTFIREVLGDLHNLDSRIWRSLGTLVFEPGRLTRRYLDGERAKYTPPFRMYVVTSVVFFLVFSLARSDTEVPAETPTAASIDASVDAAVAARLADAGLPPELPALPVIPEIPTPALLAPEATTEDPGFSITTDGDGNWRCGLDDDMSPRLRSRFEIACRRLVNEGGESFTRAFADNFSVMMLVFIPVVAAIMKVLYLFARRKYVEHLLFFLHAHTVFFLIALVAVVFDYAARRVPFLEWPAWIANVVLLIYFPVYLFVAMRHVYRQSYAWTSVKYIALGGSYIMAFMVMLLGMILYTALTL
jgi:hypothetical protein